MGEIRFTMKIKNSRKKAKWSKAREGYNVRIEIKIKSIYESLNKK